MKIQLFIKSLNNTEIGLGNTNESYVRLPSRIKNIFSPEIVRPKFVNLKNGGIVDSVHVTSGREVRINGLGDFYRNNNVNAGDKIVFERQDDGTKTEFFINLISKENSIVFQKNSRGFEVLNSDRLAQLTSDNSYRDTVNYNGNSGILIIKFKESAKKRSDSPHVTDFFSISFNGQDILNDLKSKEYFELSISPSYKILKKIVVWQSYKFNL